MSEKISDGEAPQINPLPVLGDVLNNFEWMIYSTAAVAERLAAIADRNGLLDEETKKALSALYKAFDKYEAFKKEQKNHAMAAEEKGDGEQISEG